MGKAAFEWTAEHLEQLGKEKDAVLAERWGITAKTVNLKRNALGIPAFGHFQWTPEALALLGQDSDAEVAKRLGLSKATVIAKRQALGVAPASVQKGQPSGAFAWTPQAVALLGTASDQQVAQQLGVTRLTVQQARTARGIAPAPRSKGQPSASETPKVR